MNSQAVKLRDYVSGAFDENVRFKKYRELWKEVECCNTLTDYPMMLDVELSGICNLKCEECFQNGSIEGKLGFMEMSLFKKIIDEGASKGLCSIKLQIRGESFLHPYWCECCCYAKEAGIMDIQITTNGALLDEVNIQQILDSDIDGIVFSVDSHHGDSWEGIKDGEKYESSVINNIKKFLERKKQHNRGPWVRIQTSLSVVNDNTYSETKDFVYKNFTGVDAVVVNRIHNFSNYEDSYPDLRENYELLPCKHLFQRLAIFWDGQVTTCCMDYNNKFGLGNVNTQTIEEIWQGRKIERIMQY